jgi:hypothetical protein
MDNIYNEKNTAEDIKYEEKVEVNEDQRENKTKIEENEEIKERQLEEIKERQPEENIMIKIDSQPIDTQEHVKPVVIENESPQVDVEEKQKSITVIDSLKVNYKSWLLLLVVIYIISYPNISFGYLSFVVIIFFSYVIHLISHRFDTIFTSTHKYHHHHNNFFSHFIQICVEIACAGSILLIYNFTGLKLFEPWILIFSNIFYSSIHNINYAIFHVNNVHSFHHVYEKTNIGPDIFDVLFGTKNKLNLEVENTNHYIPNIIISTMIVLIAKYYYMKDENKQKMYSIINAFIHIILAIVAVSSIIIWNNELNGPKPEKGIYIQSLEFMYDVKKYFKNLFN